MKRILAAFVLAVLAAVSAPAQKLYIAAFSGPAVLVRANGDLVGPANTREKLKLWTPVAYGDVIVTGTGGRITLSLPGTLSINSPGKSIIGYFFAGPGTDPQPFISIIAGNADINKTDGASRGIEVRDDRLEAAVAPDSADGAAIVDAAAGGTASANAPRDLLDRCAAKLETLYAKLEKLGAADETSTAELEAATDEYRTLLATASSADASSTDAATAYRKADLQNFRETQLYPAEDGRSRLIREIQYRTILARTIRSLVLSPLYMTEKSKYPDPQSRDAQTAAFFERYEAVISRYEEVFFK